MNGNSHFLFLFPGVILKQESLLDNMNNTKNSCTQCHKFLNKINLVLLSLKVHAIVKKSLKSECEAYEITDYSEIECMVDVSDSFRNSRWLLLFL